MLPERESLKAGSKKKYWAFISYSSKDRKWGAWLHRRLENYRIPNEFQGVKLFDGAVLGKNLKPVFRDRDELSGSSSLGPAILMALEQTRFLIVLCSKNSAKSEWVNKEIEDFKELGGGEYILALILDGVPNASSNPEIADDQECFPPALRFPAEPLAGDMRSEGDGKERGFLKVLAGVCQLDFDTLYRRNERIQRRKRASFASISIAIITILIGISAYAFNKKNEAISQQQEALVQKDIATKETDRANALVEDLEGSNAQKQALLLTASRADHEAAMRELDRNRKAEALAYLERALRYAPDNLAALGASANIAFRAGRGSGRLRSVSRFDGQVSSVRFSPEGHYLAVASSDGIAGVIDVVTGKEISRNNLGGFVDSVSFSPDGRLLVVTDYQNVTKIFEPSNGREVRRIGLSGNTRSVSFSRDGRHLAEASGDGSARVIEVASGKELCQARFEGIVNSVNFSRDEKYLVAASSDGTAKVMEIATGRIKGRIATDEVLMSARFDPNGKNLVARSLGNTVWVSEISTGRELGKFKIPGSRHSVKFSPDGRYFSAPNVRGLANVIEASTGRVSSRFELGNAPHSVFFSPDGRFLAVANTSGTVSVVKIANGKLWNKYSLGGSVPSVRFSADGRFLAAGSGKKVMIVEVDRGASSEFREIWHEFDHNTDTVNFSPDGHFLIVGGCTDEWAGETGGYDSTAWVIDVATGTELSRVSMCGGNINTVSACSTGRYIAVGSDDGTARIIEIDQGIEATQREPSNLGVWPIVADNFCPDGRYLVAKNNHGREIRVMEVTSGEELSRFLFTEIEASEHNRGAYSLGFSSDGRFIAAGRSNIVKIFETETGKEVSRHEFAETVVSVGLDPSGSLLAVASATTAKIIGVVTGNETDHRSEFSDPVELVKFSSNGRLLVAGNGSIARVIDVVTGSEVSHTVDIGYALDSACFSPDGRLLALANGRKIVMFVETKSGEIRSRYKLSGLVSSMNFSPDGRYLAITYQESDDESGKVIDVATGADISRYHLVGISCPVSFSPDGKYIGTHMNRQTTAKISSAGWFRAEGYADDAWRASLRLQSGMRFNQKGKLLPLTPQELINAQSEISKFLSLPPSPENKWQFGILEWSQLSSGERPESPWAE